MFHVCSTCPVRGIGVLYAAGPRPVRFEYEYARVVLARSFACRFFVRSTLPLGGHPFGTPCVVRVLPSFHRDALRVVRVLYAFNTLPVRGVCVQYVLYASSTHAVRF